MSDTYADYHEIDFGNECDLHHFHPKDTKAVILAFISQARVKGLDRLRLVHGKGKSVKKRIALSILENHPDVSDFVDEGSNWGATIIFLDKDSKE